jgi:2-C-methyl-D-erythritol 4-phosphate cytidylyltransferase
MRHSRGARSSPPRRAQQQEPVAPIVAGVVLAAGDGTRLGGPKYRLELSGQRLIDRALDLVRPLCRDLIVVLPPGHTWERDVVNAVVAGGTSRTESLRNAMAAIAPDVGIVVTHDCVRPLATPAQVVAAIEAVVMGADAAISAWETPDPLKRVRSDGSIEHIGRDGLLDESVGVELIGGRVVPVAGERWSHHLVEANDLAMFERLLTDLPRRQ